MHVESVSSTSKGLSMDEYVTEGNRTDKSVLTQIQNLSEQIESVPSTSKVNKTNIKFSTGKKLRKVKVKMSNKEHGLYIKLVSLKKKLSKLKSKTKKQTLEIKIAKKLMVNPEFVAIFENMSSAARLLTLLRFGESKKKEKGRKFTEQEKIIAFSIMKQSLKAYRFLRRIFILPTPVTLISLLHKANNQPGINENIFAQLKLKARKMNIKDRLCVLLFDEMSIKPIVTFNQRKDAISRFVTDGQETHPIFADHAQVFMIRGLIRNYKQPVSYTFSLGAKKGPELAKQIKIITKELQEAGYKVLATVCDQGANNINAIKILTNESKAMCLRRGLTPHENIFIVNDKEIIALYDPPHLLKGIRNNLLTNNLKYEINGVTKTAKWEHIQMLLKENPGYKGVSLVPKFTENHVDPPKNLKMEVKYASQVFSRTVTVIMGYLAEQGILPEECQETAATLLFFDELFDSVNGSFTNKKKYSKPLLQAVKPNSKHNKKWIEAKKVLKSMKFVDNNGVKDNVSTLENWVWTLEGLQMLVRKLYTQYKISSIWMRNLNQDPLVNFFSAVRSHGCRNMNPTAENLEFAFAALTSATSLTSVPGANCEKNLGQALLAIVNTEY